MADHAKAGIIGLSDTAYDVTKNLAQYILPAAGSLYTALALIWHFGYATEIVGTIVALDTFLAVILGLSKKSYLASDLDGTLVVDPENKAITNVAFTEPVGDRSTVTMKVVGPSTDASQD